MGTGRGDAQDLTSYFVCQQKVCVCVRVCDLLCLGPANALWVLLGVPCAEWRYVEKRERGQVLDPQGIV